ncbi:hypothetical protein LZ198_14235 [Myxococcus sp. K15C18031901]|uniref:hypothetical protein n=1 Tax=Myxococcus dinghuensis TaxID=2906761 RepID=UPI0020A81D55|nr:hypothetical protein [Myxococcus dinghuensis]MCP3100031.1 hypothetical protein [Myxococcus dinghuensis]
MNIVVKTLLAVFLLFVGFIFLAVTGLEWLPELLFFLALGWLPFLTRVLGEVTIRWGPVVEALLVAGVLAAGTHLFLGWLWRQVHAEAENARPWPLRWSLSLVASLVLLFSATMATVGIAHHVGWLASGRSQFLMRKWPMSGLLEMEKQPTYRLCIPAHELVRSGVSPEGVPARLLADRTSREKAEASHILVTSTPEGAADFIVFSRDPRVRATEGAFRCMMATESPKKVDEEELAALLSRQRVVARPDP